MTGPIPRTYRLPELVGDLVAVPARVPALFAIWVGGRLPRAMREKVIVSVAQANACSMCEHAHTRMAREAGVTDAELAAMERLDPQTQDRRTWLALAYARERTSESFTPTSDPEQQRALEDELGAQTVRDVEDVARVMTVANRIANTLNALPDRLRGHPVPGSRLPDELVINLLFLPGAWLGTLVAAFRQRKSPWTVWRQARGLGPGEF